MQICVNFQFDQYNKIIFNFYSILIQLLIINKNLFGYINVNFFELSYKSRFSIGSYNSSNPSEIKDVGFSKISSWME